jgi:hypothetical protein
MGMVYVQPPIPAASGCFPSVRWSLADRTQTLLLRDEILELIDREAILLESPT